MRNWLCSVRWRLRSRAREMREVARWKIAWALPRSIALLCFVRVCSASGDEPGDITYESAYKAWQAGAGR